jgi:hypothetical protein
MEVGPIKERFKSILIAGVFVGGEVENSENRLERQ